MKLKNSFDNILKSKGFKKIELDHIIPSMKVLKRSGDIRRKMFSFYDQNFKEWSLRVDLSLSSALKIEFMLAPINSTLYFFKISIIISNDNSICYSRNKI